MVAICQGYSHQTDSTLHNIHRYLCPNIIVFMIVFIYLSSVFQNKAEIFDKFNDEYLSPAISPPSRAQA